MNSENLILTILNLLLENFDECVVDETCFGLSIEENNCLGQKAERHINQLKAGGSRYVCYQIHHASVIGEIAKQHAERKRGDHANVIGEIAKRHAERKRGVE